MTQATVEGDFGQRLSLKLLTLQREGMIVGPQERLEIFALAGRLLSNGTVSSYSDFERYLEPAICKSAEDIELFRRGQMPPPVKHQDDDVGANYHKNAENKADGKTAGRAQIFTRPDQLGSARRPRLRGGVFRNSLKYPGF